MTMIALVWAMPMVVAMLLLTVTLAMLAGASGATPAWQVN